MAVEAPAGAFGCGHLPSTAWLTATDFAVIAPLALYTAYLALRHRFARHRAVARWALPIWIYVAITGVVVYWMLYRLYPWP